MSPNQKKQPKIYVASSWRNEFQPEVVKVLREDGFDVYDFKDSEGFSWNEVSKDYKSWTVKDYIEGLDHPAAERGFNRDMSNLESCDACVMVMPCGMSASFETGWAVGAGRLVIVYVPGMREPDLMPKMAHLITDDLKLVRNTLHDHFFDPEA